MAETLAAIALAVAILILVATVAFLGAMALLEGRRERRLRRENAAEGRRDGPVSSPGNSGTATGR